MSELIEYCEKTTMSNKESIWKKNYLVTANLNTSTPGQIRAAAMEWIRHMDTREFQFRILHGLMPTFERAFLDPDRPATLERSTNHPYCIMTEDDHAILMVNQGYLHRDKLEYMSVMKFRANYYEEFYEDYDFEDCDEYNQCKIDYYVNRDDFAKERNFAVAWIMNMGPKEFQVRLNHGLLPEFEREHENGNCSNRDIPSTLTDKNCNQRYMYRYKLRYMTTDDFKRKFS